FIKYYPKVERDKCVLCGACIASCPNKVIRIENKRVLFEYSGCISCFCCQEACPNSAIKVKKSLFAKLAGL
ncbi:MAG: 4Fe-4S binding protein, partial [Candidatus Omnitrophica bacterium]|nr:4Fe-4S binding protein [Candidatus Omnitrophota bacterium]